MNPTEVKLEEVLQGTDDNLNPTENKDDTSPPADTTNTPPADSTDDNSGHSDVADTTTNDDSTEENKEGFTAADLESEEDSDTPSEDESPAVTEAPKNLEPELQYIVDNLPDITTRIMVNGQPQQVSVKSYTQLPQGVEFASKNDELAFINAMSAQEQRAQQLQSDYRKQQQDTQAQDFEARENAAIRDDITRLQQQKLLPNFKVRTDDPSFADDPATKEVQSVLDFMNKKNQEYLESFNNGGAYKHIGFEEAFYMMPETQRKNAQKLAQQVEDSERKERANRVASETGLSNAPVAKPTVPRGTTLDQIVERIEHEW